MMVMIEASILSADAARLGEEAREAEAAGCEAVQVDVMDGHFVPNITFGPGVVKAVRSHISVALDVHLMIYRPEQYLQAFADSGADRLIVHQEACVHLHRVLQSIRDLGIESGVSINPATPLNVLEEVLDMTDFIQLMTVNPGFGGQTFIASQLDKIRRLRRMLDERGFEIPIAVDGGIDTTTAPQVVSAGATVLVAGSRVYDKGATIAENVAALRASVRS